MGFDENKSMQAANKYPNHLNKAIDYINNHDAKLNDDKKNDESKEYVTYISQKIDQQI